MKVLKNISNSLIILFLLISAFNVNGQKETETKLLIQTLPKVENSIYSVGEEFSFQIESSGLTTPLKLEYILIRNGENDISKSINNFSGEISIPCTLKKPGFALLDVSLTDGDGKVTKARYGAGANPEKIQFPDSCPDDFVKFWKKQKDECCNSPFNVNKVSNDYNPDTSVNCIGFEIDDFGGGPVTGYVAVPNGAKKQSLPAIVFFHGAGVRDAHRNMVEGIAKDNNVICMDVGAHGLPLAQSKDYYDKLKKTTLKNYEHKGKRGREESYFFNMFRRDLRAMGYLMSLPEWDGKKLIVCGGSQGAGQALFIAAMFPEVTLVNANVPALCGHNGYLSDYRCGWPKWVDSKNYISETTPEAVAASYFDVVNFAPMIKAEAVFTVGFIDPICPPESVYAAFNRLGGEKKTIYNGPQTSHETPSEIIKCIWENIRTHLNNSK
ncbi:acetylxylan esterase [uncultured Draconibacterium sp.]|uniref:acetylxylan esterase n=1 Tax=uncultured Draconibacterium sp. TaxID=1573823 RepID=UPI0025FFA782|nr:acetylxylan esterase [uncultured Draconibacterium sp.]